MKNLKNMTLRELGSRKIDLLVNIDNCNKYLESFPNTFLGPLSIKAEIKKCRKEINLINKEINGRRDFNEN